MDGLPIDASNVAIGDRIIIVKHKLNSYDKGEVKFIGKLGGKSKDIWYGIELDDPKGKHDGKGKFKAKANHGTFVMLKHMKQLVSEDFDLKAFKKVLKAEIALAKKAKLENAKNAELPQIKEEKDEGNTDRSQSLLPDTTATTGTGRASMVTKDDPLMLERVRKEAEANFKDLLKKKDKEIITLTNKLRMIEQKKDKEISNLKKKMAEGGGNSTLAKDMAKQEEKLANMMLELESTKSELENTQIKWEESELKIQELEYDKEILLLQADLATDED